MKPKIRHTPGRPHGRCPPELERIADTLIHPLVSRCGITTTKNGEWALYLGVGRETNVPISEIETLGFPTVYVIEPDEPIRIQGNE